MGHTKAHVKLVELGVMSLTWWLLTFLPLWQNIGNKLDMIKELKIALNEPALNEPAVITMPPTIAVCCLLDSYTEYVLLL